MKDLFCSQCEKCRPHREEEDQHRCIWCDHVYVGETVPVEGLQFDHLETPRMLSFRVAREAREMIQKLLGNNSNLIAISRR